MEISQQDRSNYFKTLLILIGKDRKIQESERNLFRKLATILNFSHEFCEDVMNEFLENEYIIEEPYKFENQEIAKTLIKDGITIAFSDKELHLFEMNWLKIVADKNQISEEWCFEQYENFKTLKSIQTNHQFEIEKYLGTSGK